MNYYNDIEPFAADWLEGLFRDEVIPPGRVETEYIRAMVSDYFASLEPIEPES